MTLTRLPLAAACLGLAALLAGQQAQAEQLMSWTFSGTLSSDITKAYVNDADHQLAIDEGVPATEFPPIRTASERQAIDQLMAPYAGGQSFTLKVTVDLDTPAAPDLDTAPRQFPSAVKSYELSIPDAGVLTSFSPPAGDHQGMDLLGDEYAYLLFNNEEDLVYAPDGAVRATYMFFRNLDLPYTGTPDLHMLAGMTDPSRYGAGWGVVEIASQACGPDHVCGALTILPVSATATLAVPEPAAWTTMALGLLGIAASAGLRRKRAQ